MAAVVVQWAKMRCIRGHRRGQDVASRQRADAAHGGGARRTLASDRREGSRAAFGLGRADVGFLWERWWSRGGPRPAQNHRARVVCCSGSVGCEPWVPSCWLLSSSARPILLSRPRNTLCCRHARSRSNDKHHHHRSTLTGSESERRIARGFAAAAASSIRHRRELAAPLTADLALF